MNMKDEEILLHAETNPTEQTAGYQMCYADGSLRRFVERSSTNSVMRDIFHRQKSKSSHFFTSRSTPLFAAMFVLGCLSVSSAYSVTKHECDPKDPDSCSFGAACQLQLGRGRHDTPYYRCQCPKIDCFRAGLYDPICAKDANGFDKPYFNVLCHMLEECDAQKSLPKICYGVCGQSSCKDITSVTMHHGPCPREDAARCQNGGLCIRHKLLNRSICRCPPEYAGNRCESKVPPPPGGVSNDGKEKCGSKLEMLSIFAIVLLSVVLLLIVACYCWRSRKDQREEEKLLPSSRLEQEETTPLRDNTRSDYLFPGSERSNAGSRD